ncbi:MAG: histone deacetylase [Acidobacteria bacterium]|nr:histone deacetylase [Acidobacteriota bacterium]
MAVGFVYHEDCLNHVAGHGHPERPDRIRAIRTHLSDCGLLDRLLLIRPRPCSEDHLAGVHTRDYIDTIREACASAPAHLDADTAVSAGSWDAALLSAGGAIAACDAVISGEADSAFVCTRPPGHHAETSRAMGFCLFNNIAVAARHAQMRHKIERVAIVDWDVHHGNGTQHMFEADGSILYFSTHQYPYYPGSGGPQERGHGEGEGLTINVPMALGSGDAEYVRVFRETLRPALDRFRPGIILISAGFDAHRDDPLAGMALTESGYADLTRLLIDSARDHCNGRIVSLLEGGYDLRALGASVESHLKALLGEDR